MKPFLASARADPSWAAFLAFAFLSCVSMPLARVALEASRQGVDIFDSLDFLILPLEAKNEYDIIAGAKGHLVDKEANSAAVADFLFREDD